VISCEIISAFFYGRDIYYLEGQMSGGEDMKEKNKTSGYWGGSSCSYRIVYISCEEWKCAEGDSAKSDRRED